MSKKMTEKDKLDAFIHDNTDYDTMEFSGEEEDREKYRLAVLEGVSAALPNALEVYAYASYSGTSLFPQNFTASASALLKLIETVQDPAPFWYNTLGYIYYYGRTEDGQPNYEKALQYYTVAAWSGVYEAQYKLADMLLGGLGLPKNPKAAAGLLDRLYGENRTMLEQEKFDCKFADIAFRVGCMYMDGLGFDPDPENAVSLLLQAKYAITERRKRFDFYGDETVEKKITEALKTAEARMPADYFKTRLEFDNPALIGALLRASNGIDICFANKNDELYIIAKRVPEDDEDIRKYLFSLPEMHSCVLADSVVMKIEKCRKLDIKSTDTHYFINHIEFDQKTKVWSFCYLDDPVIMLRCGGFSLER